ncbi:MAG: SAM-dependent methyltransferase [Myxococcota bacterium]
MTEISEFDDTARAITPDGSPVPVYLAAPPGDTAEVAVEVVRPPARVLELGCGVGRETRTLVACGYDVTAVDESAAMLAHVTGARALLNDIFTMDLGERFDLVVAGSHFVDDADAATRDALYAACARHTAHDGAVLLERYDPDWAAAPATYDGHVGQVSIDFEVLDRHPDGSTTARLVYELLGRTWTQQFTFTAMTADRVDAEARRHGLTVTDSYGEDDTWLALRPI